MSMVHHDQREYDVAVSDSAKKMQQRLEQQIHGSVARVQRVIEEVHTNVPDDSVVRGTALRFESTKERNGSIVLYKPQETKAVQIHPHAMSQIAGRTNIRNFYTVINELRGKGQWGYDLIAKMLQDTYAHLNGDRFLLRQLGDTLFGFLSDQYRRLDSRPILDAFVAALQKYGARPLDGFALTTKDTIRAILPYVFEPCPGEIIAIGASLSNSNYGDGFLEVSGWFRRVWCTNDAELEDVLKQVHLGKRLPDNIEFSKLTYQLDTDAMASAVGDIVGSVLAPKSVNRFLDTIKRANEEKVQPQAIAAWAKKNLNKGEAEKAVAQFNSPDVETLPPGQTNWRWSNAISWLARETEDEHRRLELQAMAGELINKKAA